MSYEKNESGAFSAANTPFKEDIKRRIFSSEEKEGEEQRREGIFTENAVEDQNISQVDEEAEIEENEKGERQETPVEQIESEEASVEEDISKEISPEEENIEQIDEAEENDTEIKEPVENTVEPEELPKRQLSEEEVENFLKYEKSTSTFMKRKLEQLQEESYVSFGESTLKLRKTFSKVEQEKRELQRLRILNRENPDSPKLLGKKKAKTDDTWSALMKNAKKNKSRVQIEKERYLEQERLMKENMLKQKSNKEEFIKIETTF